MQRELDVCSSVFKNAFIVYLRRYQMMVAYSEMHKLGLGWCHQNTFKYSESGMYGNDIKVGCF